MDHKVSKDMISSGMIPSGEKKQADLGRTQYGSTPSPSSLFDAYKSMYEKKEEVINEHHKKDADGNTIPHEHEEELNEGKIPAGLQAYLDKKKGKKEDKKDMKEGAGLYANIHAKRKRGGKMREKGEKGAPSSQDFANAARTAKEEVEVNEVAPLLAAPLIAKGLMALKGAKVGAAALKGAAAFKKGLTTAKAIGAAGKITTTGGKLASGTKKVGMMQKAGSAVRSAGASMKNNPTNTALVGTMAMPRGGSTPQRTGGPVIGQYNDVDLFDLVKGQLLDEGIDEKDALKIMVELSQEDLKIIVNEMSLANVARITAAGTVAAMGANAINKQLQNKKKMEQGGKFKKGGIMDTIQKKNQMMQGM